ncbi:unnamed protein product [marine sediment metagenome]|uniref:Tetrapyrrole methylase domain-containing protein n=1 Tax=marine sediment metagenome TaxID=412755 RepID=X1D7D0_9ZZZZ
MVTDIGKNGLNHGKIHIVSTPIGNLEDITLRALRVLKEVGLIAAESREHTRKLCTHYNIKTPTKMNLSVRNPEMESAAREADTPGTGTNLILASIASLCPRVP